MVDVNAFLITLKVPELSTGSVYGYRQCLKGLTLRILIFIINILVLWIESRTLKMLGKILLSVNCVPSLKDFYFSNFEVIVLHMVICGTSFISNIYSYVI